LRFKAPGSTVGPKLTWFIGLYQHSLTSWISFTLYQFITFLDPLLYFGVGQKVTCPIPINFGGSPKHFQSRVHQGFSEGIGP